MSSQVFPKCSGNAPKVRGREARGDGLQRSHWSCDVEKESRIWKSIQKSLPYNREQSCHLQLFLSISFSDSELLQMFQEKDRDQLVYFSFTATLTQASDDPGVAKVSPGDNRKMGLLRGEARTTNSQVQECLPCRTQHALATQSEWLP